MSSELVIREAKPEDAAEIVRVRIRSWQAAYAQTFAVDALRRLDDHEADRVEARRSWLHAPRARSHTLVAVSDGVVVGFVDGAPARDHDVDATRVGELLAIYVTPESWGTGAGRRLMAQHLERLRSAGFDEAVLWVLEDNPRARRFYEAAGWTLDGGVKDDELLGTTVREVRYRIGLA